MKLQILNHVAGSLGNQPPTCDYLGAFQNHSNINSGVVERGLLQKTKQNTHFTFITPALFQGTKDAPCELHAGDHRQRPSCTSVQP